MGVGTIPDESAVISSMPSRTYKNTRKKGEKYIFDHTCHMMKIQKKKDMIMSRKCYERDGCKYYDLILVMFGYISNTVGESVSYVLSI